MTPPLVRDPVYLQLNKALRDVIRSGQIPLGERFWTEREIGLRFGVSRATANKALSNLVAYEFHNSLGPVQTVGPASGVLHTIPEN